jgi:hypothetical protein
MTRVLAALEAQPAPLVADSREALAEALGAYRGWNVDKPDHDQADSLLASGVVSVAGDRDRALRADGFDEAMAEMGASPYSDCIAVWPVNPHRESEGK